MEILYWPFSLLLVYVGVFAIVFYLMRQRMRQASRSFVALIISLIAVTLASIVLPRNDLFYTLLYTAIPILSVTAVLLAIHSRRSIIVVLVAYLLSSVSGLIISGIAYALLPAKFETYYDSETFMLALDAANTTVAVLLAVLASCIRKKGKKSNTPYGQVHSFTFFSLACFTVSLAYLAPVIQLVGETKLASASIAFVLSGVVFLSGVLFTQILVNKNLRYKGEVLAYKQYTDGQKEHMESLLQWNKEMRKLKHDIDAHYICLNELLNKGCYHEAKQYSGQLVEAMEIDSTAKTGNMVIDVLIGHLENKYNVMFSVKGTAPSSLALQEAEMCTLFFNILSNAAEAAAQTPSKAIELAFKYLSTHLYVEIANPCPSSVALENGLPVTTKGRGHGYGIHNAVEIVERYNGKIEFMYHDNVFTTSLSLVNVIKESVA